MSTAPMLPSGGDKGLFSWLKKPENRTTAFFLAIGGFAVFWFWGLIVPFIAATLDYTWDALWHGIAIVATLLFLTSKRVHVFAKALNRWLTGLIVDLDPIGIRKALIGKTKQRKGQADEAVGSVRGLREGLRKRMAVNIAEYNSCMGRLQVANEILKRTGASPEASRQAQRSAMKDAPYAKDLEDLIKGQQAQMQHYDDAISKLTRLGELCDDYIEKKEREIRIEQDNQVEARGLRTVRKSLSSIFGKDGGVESEMDDMAREKLEQEYQDEIGQFDQFLELSSRDLAKADFNNLAALRDIQNKLDNFGSGQGATPPPKQIAAAPAALSFSTPVAEKQGVEYFK